MMSRMFKPLLLLIVLAAVQVPALAWSNHTLVSYRAFDRMPEVTQAAPVVAEPLEVFLKAQESAIADLLAKQELWARANMPWYAPRSDALAFKVDPRRSDADRRQAFVTALRISPLSRFALYVLPDRQITVDPGKLLAHDAVNFLPEQPNDERRFARVQPGDTVAPLAVLATATDEPDYGLDINLWDDSPSAWGKTYGFGKLPFGNPTLYFSTQAPFHMGFYHEDWLIFKAAPFIQRTYPLLRIEQYSSLAALAFRSGHAYWGWRFSGLAMHYIQDLTQPYHASLSPGDSTARLIVTNAMAMAGFPRRRDALIVLLSNRHLALEKFQNESIVANAHAGLDTALEDALRDGKRDASYPAWTVLYARDTVSREAHDSALRTVRAILDAVPPAYVADPAFDFGVKESGIHLLEAIDKQGADKRAELQAEVAGLLAHLGAHSRNTLRGILRAAQP